MADTELPKERVETHTCPARGGRRIQINQTLEKDHVYRGKCVYCGEVQSTDATGSATAGGPNPDGTNE